MADAATESTEQHTMQEAIDHANGQWQGDFTEEELTVPYKKEGNTKDDSKDKVSTDSEADKVDTQDEEEVATVEPIAEPISVITTEDPGDYTPADYSFEVTLADGKTRKITTPEEAEKLADNPDNFETPKQLMDFINKQNKMQRNLDRDYDKWESQKSKYNSQVEEQKTRDETVQNLTNGFEYLIAKGLMPKLAPADAVADWSNPEVAKHDGVKEQIELINYMTKENAAREKAGIPLLTSALDAYNAWQMESGRNTAEQQAKDEAAEQKRQAVARKAAGARVAGTSPAPQAPYVPKGIAVGNPNVLRRGSASVWDD